jgi:BirA family transcriptional regulator, biotin operon repressor / biotin---[acetyl-CoA-carboxylase] ligase
LKDLFLSPEDLKGRPASPAGVLQRLERLADTANLPPGLDRQAVVRYGAGIGSVIDHYPVLPRAMDHARKQIAATGASGRAFASGTVLLAETLGESKGRFQRLWHAPLGGLWGCLIHANTLLPESRRFIPFAVGIACCEAVRLIGGQQAELRWVNDLLWDGVKLAGFLVEGYTEPRYGEEFDLVGFGINVNNSRFPEGLVGQATSLAEQFGKEVPLSRFTEIFLAQLAWNFGILYHEEARNLRGDGFSGADGGHHLLNRWRSLSGSIGRRVVFGFDLFTAPQYRAEVLGLDDDGGLRLKLADGSVKTEYSGEIRYLPEPEASLCAASPARK